MPTRTKPLIRAAGHAEHRRERGANKVRNQRDVPTEKRCSTCKEVKPAGEFYPSTSACGLTSRCKVCEKFKRMEREQRPKEPTPKVRPTYVNDGFNEDLQNWCLGKVLA